MTRRETRSSLSQPGGRCAHAPTPGSRDSGQAAHVKGSRRVPSILQCWPRTALAPERDRSEYLEANPMAQHDRTLGAPAPNSHNPRRLCGIGKNCVLLLNPPYPLSEVYLVRALSQGPRRSWADWEISSGYPPREVFNTPWEQAPRECPGTGGQHKTGFNLTEVQGRTQADAC